MNSLSSFRPVKDHSLHPLTKVDWNYRIYIWSSYWTRISICDSSPAAGWRDCWSIRWSRRIRCSRRRGHPGPNHPAIVLWQWRVRRSIPWFQSQGTSQKTQQTQHTHFLKTTHHLINYGCTYIILSFRYVFPFVSISCISNLYIKSYYESDV